MKTPPQNPRRSSCPRTPSSRTTPSSRPSRATGCTGSSQAATSTLPHLANMRHSRLRDHPRRRQRLVPDSHSGDGFPRARTRLLEPAGRDSLGNTQHRPGNRAGFHNRPHRQGRPLQPGPADELLKHPLQARGARLFPRLFQGRFRGTKSSPVHPRRNAGDEDERKEGIQGEGETPAGG